MKNNIILIGYMGCGKSTVGRQLAEELKVSFLDTDVWIEKKEGICISEIFNTKGEPCFRDMETQCLKELLEQKECLNGKQENPDKAECMREKVQVISVGGGLPVREENQKLLKQLGQVIYLKASPDTIYGRIKGDTTRPLLQTQDPLQKIKDMLKEREEKYQAAAHRIVEVDDKSIIEIIQEIVRNDKI